MTAEIRLLFIANTQRLPHFPQRGVNPSATYSTPID